MEGNRKMTVAEVLEKTEELLGGICVPVSMRETIANPIAEAMMNLRACLDAMAAAAEVPAAEGENGNGQQADA